MSGPSVAVIGLGSMGAMTAWQLAKRGAKVTGYDRYSPGHDRSGHGGESRIFRTAYIESPAYVPLLRRAKELWRDLETESRTRLLYLTGALTIGTAEAEGIASVRAAQEMHGLDLEEITGAEARRRFPQYRFADHEMAVLDREAGYLRPELAVLRASLLAEANGAQIRRYTTVTAIEPGRDGVFVRTSAGDIERYDHAVVSTGPWASKLLSDIGYSAPIETRLGISAWFPAQEQSLFAPDRCPVFIRVSGTECYGLPALDGSGLKLGLNGHNDNRLVTDPDNLDSSISPDDLSSFRAAAAEVSHAVYTEPTRVGAFMEGYTPDGHGIVGRLPGSESVTILAGFSGHGFKLAPSFGEQCANSVLGGSIESPISQLDPTRFAANGETLGHPRPAHVDPQVTAHGNT